ncbi:hypothetical protein GCM10008934_25340 [Virgibacillus salarius]
MYIFLQPEIAKHNEANDPYGFFIIILTTHQAIKTRAVSK